MEKVILENLWGGIIYNLKIELILQRVVFNVKVYSEKGMEYYELIFEKVPKFSFLNEYKDSPWNYIDLGEIWYEKKYNFYIFYLVLWESEFKLKCENYKANLIYAEYNE